MMQYKDNPQIAQIRQRLEIICVDLRTSGLSADEQEVSR